jgi:hypothetical protein
MTMDEILQEIDDSIANLPHKDKIQYLRDVQAAVEIMRADIIDEHLDPPRKAWG